MVRLNITAPFMEKFVFTAKDLARQDILQRLSENKINTREASVMLHLSMRQTIRLKRKMEKKDPSLLLHKGRGKPSNRRVNADEEELITSLVKEKYLDFSPTFTAEKLREQHNITRDPRTIHRILVEANLWKKKKAYNAQKQVHRTWRQRRHHFGEMIQFDGSYEHWLEDRNHTGRMCLLAAIDDSTSNITYAQFASHEGVFPVFGFWKEYLLKYGKPQTIYLDKFSTYNQNQPVKNEINDTLTQFERACSELQIELIKANSPQAKGRVERLFRTLQDRLIKELRLANIETLEDANIFLQNIFVPQFNTKFSVVSTKEGDFHRPLSDHEKKNISSIFSRQEKRVLQNDFTISFQKTYYQLTKEQPQVALCKKETILVEEWTDHTIHLKLRGKELNFTVLPTRPMKQSHITPSKPNTNPYAHPKAHKPAKNHPWKTYRIQL